MKRFLLAAVLVTTSLAVIPSCPKAEGGHAESATRVTAVIDSNAVVAEEDEKQPPQRA